MPELPDVETMRRYLRATSLHRRIENVEVRSCEVLKDTSVEDLAGALVGRAMISTRRHGKHLFALTGDETRSVLMLHFGMTGGLLHVEEADGAPDYARLLLRFADGGSLAYLSMRKLGEVQVVDSAEHFVDKRGLGPDALDPDFNLDDFRRIVSGRRVMTKSLLMDQHTIAGIGNVYADEILFQAGVHPRMKVSALGRDSVADVFAMMRDVLETAIECQAQPERFPESFLTPHRHPDGRCPVCGAELERVKVSSRTAYICPTRQRKERV